MGAGGRIVVPASFRKALDLAPGDDVILVLGDGELQVVPARDAVRRAQQLVRRHVPEGRRLSEELLRERKRDVRRG